MKYEYEYPRPAVTADILVFSIKDGALHILLIERGVEPFKGQWAIPGGFLQMDEDIDECARRELEEETGLSNIPLRQLRAYGSPNRDPRYRVVTVAYIALVRSDDLLVEGGSDAKSARWWPTDSVPNLAFDHQKILEDGRERLAADVRTNIQETGLTAFEFLPEKFTLSEAQSVFEALQGSKTDKRNFRKWITNEWKIQDTGEKLTGGRHRPAALFMLSGKKRSDAA